ncbi:MAG TPA: hypothetical protein PKD00_05635 [Burkholderiales bacterium]|nr:hypothetical protein [Burkholderiales bacterium]
MNKVTWVTKYDKGYIDYLTRLFEMRKNRNDNERDEFDINLDKRKSSERLKIERLIKEKLNSVDELILKYKDGNRYIYIEVDARIGNNIFEVKCVSNTENIDNTLKNTKKRVVKQYKRLKQLLGKNFNYYVIIVCDKYSTSEIFFPIDVTCNNLENVYNYVRYSDVDNLNIVLY